MAVAPSPPEFVRGDGIDAIAEFRAFISAVGYPAVAFLAELSEWHNFGTFEDVPESDSTGDKRNGLYRRIFGSWVVFYTAQPFPFRITVLHAARFNPPSFGVVQAEAALRLGRLGP
jgi:hypothetical protein